MAQITWTLTSTAMTHHQASALIKSRTEEKLQSSDKSVAPCATGGTEAAAERLLLYMTHNLCISQLRKSVSISAQLREGFT